MSLSKTLYQLQELDCSLDNAAKRISQIHLGLQDRQDLDQALSLQNALQDQLSEKQAQLQAAEGAVEDQRAKFDQNQKRLYGGAITNPKELEDLQLEASALQKYLGVLEERQLHAMLEAEQAQQKFDQSSTKVAQLAESKSDRDAILLQELSELETIQTQTQHEKQRFLEKNDLPDLATYENLRKSLNGIAVTLMISNSCSSCGSNIPSAIAQEVRSLRGLTSCPTCRRILHPG